MSAVMPCWAQKSSISCVSGMPPISEPARLRRFMIRLNTLGEGCGVAGAPTSAIVPSRRSSAKKASRSCGAATVLRMKSKLLACAFISARLRETTTSSAPSASAAWRLLSDVVNATTRAPRACASLMPMCPSPPMPTTPTFLPGPAPQWRSGDQVVMPAHSSGATAASCDSGWPMRST